MLTSPNDSVPVQIARAITLLEKQTVGCGQPAEIFASACERSKTRSRYFTSQQPLGDSAHVLLSWRLNRGGSWQHDRQALAPISHQSGERDLAVRGHGCRLVGAPNLVAAAVCGAMPPRRSLARELRALGSCWSVSSQAMRKTARAGRSLVPRAGSSGRHSARPESILPMSISPTSSNTSNG